MIIINNMNGKVDKGSYSELYKNSYIHKGNQKIRKEIMKSNNFHPVFILLIFLSIFSKLCFAGSDNHPEIKVTYIANEGFLISSNSHKILIDALFYHPQITFCDVPSKEILIRMEQAQPPFHNIDLISVTHRHVDHFNSISVSKHLKNNEKCKLICPDQVFQKLQDESPYFDTIKHQIVYITPELYSIVDTTVNKIHLNILRLRHGPYYVKDEKTGEMYDRHKDVENLGYIIELDGGNVLHVGDGMLTINEECFKKLNTKIDLAFVESYEISDEAIHILSTYLKARYVIFMHLPTEGREEIINTIKTQFPDGVIFEESLESRLFQ